GPPSAPPSAPLAPAPRPGRRRPSSRCACPTPASAPPSGSASAPRPPRPRSTPRPPGSSRPSGACAIRSPTVEGPWAFCYRRLWRFLSNIREGAERLLAVLWGDFIGASLVIHSLLRNVIDPVLVPGSARGQRASPVRIEAGVFGVTVLIVDRHGRFPPIDAGHVPGNGSAKPSSSESVRRRGALHLPTSSPSSIGIAPSPGALHLPTSSIVHVPRCGISPALKSRSDPRPLHRSQRGPGSGREAG